MHWQTHTVFNQSIPLNNSNLYLSDGALCEAVTREGAGWDSDFLASIGQQLGTAESLELGRLANVNPPELLRYDAQGRHLDDVRFHPAWHLLMQALCTNRVHNLAWEEDARSGAFVARAARFMLHAQVEAGSLCPITMTFAATPLLLQMLPTPFQDWTTPLLSDRYDSHLLPGGQKRGLLIGMGMTEKQGGSDVMSNTTRAERLEDGSYRLHDYRVRTAQRGQVQPDQRPGGGKGGHRHRKTPDDTNAHHGYIDARCGAVCISGHAGHPPPTHQAGRAHGKSNGGFRGRGGRGGNAV